MSNKLFSGCTGIRRSCEAKSEVSLKITLPSPVDGKDKDDSDTRSDVDSLSLLTNDAASFAFTTEGYQRAGCLRMMDKHQASTKLMAVTYV